MAKAVKLNLGCGLDKRRGFINVDVDERLKPDLVHDLAKKLPFKDATASEILLQDVLEHFTKEMGLELLRECSRVLQDGGKLLIRVPNVSAIVSKYQRYPDLLMHFLYGNTAVSGVWGAHKYGYTPEILKETAAPLQLQLLKSQHIDTNYLFVLKKTPGLQTRLRIAGTGWHPAKATLEKHRQEKLFVATDLVSFVWSIFQPDPKVWCISRKYPAVLSKTLLRALAPQVTALYVPTAELAHFVQTELQYSHLRVIVEN